MTTDEIDAEIRPLNDFQRLAMQAALSQPLELPSLNSDALELLIDLRGRKLLKRDEEDNHLMLTRRGRAVAERLNYDAHSIEDRLTFTARTSSAPRHVCQLMDEAAKEITTLRIQLADACEQLDISFQ